MPEIRNISFDSEAHVYTDDGLLVYTSVTTKIKQVERPFDREYWLQVKAKERGISKEQLGQEWDEINKLSCIRGNNIHKKLEDSVNSIYKPSELPIYKTGLGSDIGILANKRGIANLEELANSELRYISIDIYNYLVQLIIRGWTLYPELRVYLSEYKIAGTIDLPAIRGNEVIIIDWKTNKDELSFKSGYYKKEWRGGMKVKTDMWINKKEYFLSPISHLEYCKGNVYALQLSMYARIMWEWGFKIKGLVLYHIRDNFPVKYYNIQYMEYEADKVIKL